MSLFLEVQKALEDHFFQALIIILFGLIFGYMGTGNHWYREIGIIIAFFFSGWYFRGAYK